MERKIAGLLGAAAAVIAITTALSFSAASAAQAGSVMSTSYYSPRSAEFAANRRLPFGTRLRLTNPRNGRSVVVVIRDRGPFVRGRSLDISRAYAQQLGFTRAGVARLEVSYLH